MKKLVQKRAKQVRGTLSNNFIRACSLLQPIVDAQRFPILLSRVLAIDETPIKVGVNRAKHKMNKGYIWPIYGDRNEIIYNYNKSRAAIVIKELLGEFHGTLLSDGYSAYKSYVKGVAESDLESTVTHASCWVHARRQFVKLEKMLPVEYERAQSMRVFLRDSDVQLDTNHLEREIRPIAIGRNYAESSLMLSVPDCSPKFHFNYNKLALVCHSSD